MKNLLILFITLMGTLSAQEMPPLQTNTTATTPSTPPAEPPVEPSPTPSIPQTDVEPQPPQTPPSEPAPKTAPPDSPSQMTNQSGQTEVPPPDTQSQMAPIGDAMETTEEESVPEQAVISFEEPDCCTPCREILLEAKAGWYFPTCHLFREIYGWGDGIYSLEANFQIADEWYIYSSGSFFIADGHSEGSNKPYDTTIWFIPVTIGAKYLSHFCAYDYQLAWYAGLGAVGTYMQIHDHDPFIKEHFRNFGGGANFQLGGIWYLTENFLIDLFTQYTFNYVPTSKETANLSGVSLGGSVGWSF